MGQNVTGASASLISPDPSRWAHHPSSAALSIWASTERLPVEGTFQDEEEDTMTDRKLLPGKFVWFEHVSKEAKKAQTFYGAVLGWTVQPFPMGPVTYEMIHAGDTMLGGYAAPKDDRSPSHWIAYVSVGDGDPAAKTTTANGGKIVEAPHDIPSVGRAVRIADPHGAEICLFTNASGDPADTGSVPAGHFVWNELHTTDVTKALAFYEKVVGFSHRGMDMGPGRTYYALQEEGVGP